MQPGAHVVGVDMFQEALDFASERVRAAGLPATQWHPVAGAVGDTEGDVEIRFGNPLEGTNSLGNPSGANTRKIRMDCLDRWLAPHSAHPVFLLKLDIEGAAGAALRGAVQLLARTRFVIVETHHESETQAASESLIRAGFVLFRVHGRSMWWETSRATPAA
jgi:FkbM family methyltransferase